MRLWRIQRAFRTFASDIEEHRESSPEDPFLPHVKPLCDAWEAVKKMLSVSAGNPSHSLPEDKVYLFQEIQETFFGQMKTAMEGVKEVSSSRGDLHSHAEGIAALFAERAAAEQGVFEGISPGASASSAVTFHPLAWYVPPRLIPTLEVFCLEKAIRDFSASKEVRAVFAGKSGEAVPNMIDTLYWKYGQAHKFWVASMGRQGFSESDLKLLMSTTGEVFGCYEALCAQEGDARDGADEQKADFSTKAQAFAEGLAANERARVELVNSIDARTVSGGAGGAVSSVASAEA